MKRPEYVELSFEAKKGTLLAATKRYFKRLEGKVLKINFGELRVKKVFEYKIISSGFETWTSWYPEKKYSAIKIKARLKKEPAEETS